MVLKEWYKGTGGGSGLPKHFETWLQDKHNKYDIDEAYDHTDISERPSILLDLYSKKKKYLTVIFMWDQMLDQVLCSKYNPLKIGRGESGLLHCNDDNSMSGISSCANSKTTRRLKNSPRDKGQREAKDPRENMATMVKSIIQTVLVQDSS